MAEVIGTVSLQDLVTQMGGSSLPDPTLYQYYKCLSENTILINQEIDENLVEYAIIPLKRMDADENITHIDIIIDSPGGEIYSGFALISAIEHCKTPITMHIVGMAASMACYIAMAKSPTLKVVCDEWSVGLIHAGSTMLEGNSNSVKDMFKFNERYEEKIKEYVLSHTKIDEKMYNEIERYEFWMSSSDLLKYNVVDEIV